MHTLMRGITTSGSCILYTNININVLQTGCNTVLYIGVGTGGQGGGSSPPNIERYCIIFIY